MQDKGIVMQIADGQAIVMTKDCGFRKMPFLDGMAVGQEVEVPTQTTQTVRKKPLAWFGTPLRNTGVLAASLLLAVGVWGSQSLFSTQTAYAYVTVDINPSVEFSIDHQQYVVTVTGLNDDGQQVLADLKVKGLPVDQAVKSLTEAAKKKGYFDSNTQVIITASPAVSDEKLASDHIDLDKIESDLVAQVKTVATTAGSNVDVEGIRVSKDVRDAAQKAGVSPGKYAVYLNAQSNGIEVSLDELKGHSISKSVGNKGESLSQVVQSLEGGAQLDHLLEAFKKDGKITPHTSNPVTVEPRTKQNDKPDASQPPGQQKKSDDSNKKSDDSNKNSKDNKNHGVKKSGDRSSDREHSDIGEASGTDSSNQSDDAGDPDRKKHKDGHEQKGKGEQNHSHNYNWHVGYDAHD